MEGGLVSARAGPASPLAMIAGLAVWGVAFNALYGLQALGCARGWNETGPGLLSLHRGLLVASWAALLALHGGVILWTRRRRAAAPRKAGPEPFVETISVAVAWLGLAATAVTGALVTVLSLCEP
jgi:hypothetical protein